jgi:hypothetical protein
MGDSKLNIKKQKPRIILETQGKKIVKKVKQKRKRKGGGT